MKQELKHLPDSELEVMLAVWNHGEKVHTGEIVERLKCNGWQTSTIQNLLSRLCDKGFLSCEKVGRLNYYTPLIAEEEYRSRETASFLKKLHRNSAASLMTTLVNSVDLTEEEIKELKSILDKGAK